MPEKYELTVEQLHSISLESHGLLIEKNVLVSEHDQHTDVGPLDVTL